MGEIITAETTQGPDAGKPEEIILENDFVARNMGQIEQEAMRLPVESLPSVPGLESARLAR